ncbi:hypothetical protein D3C84_1200710 [compost metagenome]
MFLYRVAPPTPYSNTEIGLNDSPLIVVTAFKLGVLFGFGFAGSSITVSVINRYVA